MLNRCCEVQEKPYSLETAAYHSANGGTSVDFGDVSETGSGVSVDLTDEGVDTIVCRTITGPLGAAVLRLTSGG